MTTPLAFSLASSGLDPALVQHIQPQLARDLDTCLQFAKSYLIVTDRRLLTGRAGEINWTDWPFRQGLRLQHHDHAGVGRLALVDDEALLQTWRFTLGQNVAALRLLGQFESQLQAHVAGLAPVFKNAVHCPTCKAELASDLEECQQCQREQHTPPSTWTLFRLWRFARPYQGRLLLGFLLTLSSTAATLVAPTSPCL
jgi:ATP-binding cassette, subfamily B, bacterial